MAPLRRYLRISRYTVLETRVYLDDPSLQSWLLGRDAALDKVIAAVKPLVLPKLMEERDRGPKRKSIRDVVRGGEFLARGLERRTSGPQLTTTRGR
jgi:hypothetical protein